MSVFKHDRRVIEEESYTGLNEVTKLIRSDFLNK